MIASKNEARKSALQRRKRAFASEPFDIANLISPIVEDYEYLAFYMPMRTELNCLPAMEKLHNASKTILVPVIQAKDQPLLFYHWTPDAEMVEGEFGAMIPVENQKYIPEIVFAPLLAFDAYGTRLGYGGGFYDRTMAKLRMQYDTPYIGLAFEAQRSETPIPREETDIPLDAIITENGLKVFKSDGF